MWKFLTLTRSPFAGAAVFAEGNALDVVVNALDSVFSIATKVFNYALENPLLTFFIAVGMIPVGCYVFSCIKGLSKH